MSRYWIIKSDFFSLLIMSPFLMNQIARNQRSMSWSEIKILLSHVLNPIFLISPIPLSPRELPENQPLMPNRRVDELSEAFLSLCGGITSIVLAFVIYKLFLTHVIHRHLFLDLRIGWIIYLYYYFFWLSLLRLSFSCARLLGYKVPSPSFYALLAANPLDRWKAWNAYLYSWFLTAVFLPLSRTTRSIVFAAAAVFLLNFFFHDQLYVCYVWFYPDSINFELLKLLRGETLFFALHFLMVVIGFATLRFWPPMRTRAGWIGVAVTHLMMAVTHSVVWLNY